MCSSPPGRSTRNTSASVRRSVYVEDKLFSISNYGALVNELNEPEIELAEVLFYPRGE